MAPRPAVSIALARTMASLSPLILGDGSHKGKHKEYPEWGSPDFYFHIGISICLVLLGGVFAGLTLGLMGLDELHLRVLRTSSDDPKERENAASVLRLLSKGRHWVLVVRQYCAHDLRTCELILTRHPGLTSRQRGRYKSFR